jgi:hypothetical protein
MKKLILLLWLIITTGCLVAQTSQVSATDDPMEIADAHNFGSIRQGRPVTYAFTFYNKGKEPLKLENVTASCGCTTPEWSSEEVAPYGKGIITVGYNAAGEGNFEKSVTIVYNGGKTKIILIKGLVTKPIPSAPVNSSVQLLKQIN